MNYLQTVRLYIKEMVHQAGPQMKIMLLDKDTTSLVSCAYGQNEMMQKEVYLFERMDNNVQRESIKYLKCIVFIRPTPDNIHLLTEELRNPHYAQYYIYFSNIIGKADVKQLAEADEQEMVRDVQEFFIDAIPLSPHLATLSLPRPYEHGLSLAVQAQRRCADAVVSLLLALRKRPLIRYQRSSSDAQKLASKVAEVMRREEALFDETTADTLLLVIDRFEDPVTPLLNQWTYEAMVHELLSFRQNCVAVESQKFVLSEQDDDFYAKNISANFGEIGASIKELMNDFQQKAKTHKNIESIADMKSFVDEYPLFRKNAGNVTKHVTIVSELSRVVGVRNLLEISELEQSIVVDGDHARCLDRIHQLLIHPKTTQLDVTRLLLLYALRFESNPANDTRGLIAKLRSTEMSSTVEMLLRYAGVARRKNDLFKEGSPMEITKKFIKGLKGVENIYTQHAPALSQMLEQTARGRLPEQAYPHVNKEAAGSMRLSNVIVFIVGGATYAESAIVRAWNEKRASGGGIGSAPTPAVLLATTHMHNTTSFIEQLNAMR